MSSPPLCYLIHSFKYTTHFCKFLTPNLSTLLLPCFAIRRDTQIMQYMWKIYVHNMNMKIYVENICRQYENENVFAKMWRGKMKVEERGWCWKSVWKEYMLKIWKFVYEKKIKVRKYTSREDRGFGRKYVDPPTTNSKDERSHQHYFFRLNSSYRDTDNWGSDHHRCPI